jgi:aldose 1-epimerase
LAANNGPNCLHGDRQGWGNHTFEGPTEIQRDGWEAILFTHVSHDGEEGFRGTVELRVWYTTCTKQEQGYKVYVLEAEYEAELVGEKGV